MSGQLPATIPPGALATSADTRLVPALIVDAGEQAGWRYVEFFTANIRNPHTRRAYARACSRCPKHVVKTGKTPVLEGAEWRKLLDAIPTETVRDLRDRALIATLTYSFARISAAVKMTVEDLRPKGAGWQIRLHEKGGKHHTMPCHHALAETLHAYIAAAGIAGDSKGYLFRTSRGHAATVLSEQPMSQPDAWRMIRRRATAAGIMAPIGNHTFRATGITAYLGNGGALEHAQAMATHESPRTTKLCDRTKDRLTQDEVERIRL